MKVLYAIQGTGNGHITRAKEILPVLKRSVETDVLVSGMHSELELGYPVKHRYNGLGFKFGKKGGVDFAATWKDGSPIDFLKEVRDLDLSAYDLVINDFEPISAWAAKNQSLPCFGLSNQGALLNGRVPKPAPKKGDSFAKALLKYYAPVDVNFGFHYWEVDPYTSTPIIRNEIRELSLNERDFYLVYLPFYGDDKIITALSTFSCSKWKVFSKHASRPYTSGNLEINPLSSDLFLSQLASCKGVISSAGFGLTSEVLFLGKKLLAIPMKGQYEQRCNAFSLSQLGITVVKSLKPKWHQTIQEWLSSEKTVRLDFPNRTQSVVDGILNAAVEITSSPEEWIISLHSEF